MTTAAPTTTVWTLGIVEHDTLAEVGVFATLHGAIEHLRHYVAARWCEHPNSLGYLDSAERITDEHVMTFFNTVLGVTYRLDEQPIK